MANVLLIGGLGELGKSIGAELTRREHNVVNVTRREGRSSKQAVTTHAASKLIEQGWAEIAIVIPRLGPKRLEQAPILDNEELSLYEIIKISEFRVVLLSTILTLEGYGHDVREYSSGKAASEYGRGNVSYENYFLGNFGPQLSVLRLTNIFFIPSSKASEQNMVMPWPLLSESLRLGQIEIKRLESDSIHFVSPVDVVKAIEILFSHSPPKRVCVTRPGLEITFFDLAEVAKLVVFEQTSSAVGVSFGSAASPTPGIRGGWLASKGWKTELTQSKLRRTMNEWLTAFAASPP